MELDVIVAVLALLLVRESERVQDFVLHGPESSRRRSNAVTDFEEVPPSSISDPVAHAGAPRNLRKLDVIGFRGARHEAQDGLLRQIRDRRLHDGRKRRIGELVGYRQPPQRPAEVIC
jgi:hypothetical protein